MIVIGPALTPEKTALFLKTWKIAVQQLSSKLFDVRSPTVQAADSREDLRPDPEAIEHYVNSTPGEHLFLFAVITFFSYSLIEDIFERAELRSPRLYEYATLTDTQRQLIYSLIESYEGW